jgi:hypothetical protein
MTIDTLTSRINRAKACLEKGKDRRHYVPEPDGTEELVRAVNEAICILNEK